MWLNRNRVIDHDLPLAFPGVSVPLSSTIMTIARGDRPLPVHHVVDLAALDVVDEAGRSPERATGTRSRSAGRCPRAGPPRGRRSGRTRGRRPSCGAAPRRSRRPGRTGCAASPPPCRRRARGIDSARLRSTSSVTRPPALRMHVGLAEVQAEGGEHVDAGVHARDHGQVPPRVASRRPGPARRRSAGWPPAGRGSGRHATFTTRRRCPGASATSSRHAQDAPSMRLVDIQSAPNRHDESAPSISSLVRAADATDRRPAGRQVRRAGSIAK